MNSKKKTLVLFVALLTAYAQAPPTAQANAAQDLSYEYIDLLYQLDDLYDEMDVLQGMLPPHEQYLVDLETAMCNLQDELMENPHTAAEQEAIFAQLKSLAMDYGEMSTEVANIEIDICLKQLDINEVEYRMAVIEYELAGL